MKITYLAPVDIQVARVDRQSIVYFCEALARIGVDVELVAMRIRLLPGEARESDPLALYKVRKRFPVRLVRVPVGQDSNARWIAVNRLLVHAISAIRIAFRRRAGAAQVVYLKNYVSALAVTAIRTASGRRFQIAFEAHLPPKNRLQRYVLRTADHVIANSHALATDLREHGVVGGALGIHQGVDVDLVEELRLSKDESRVRTNLPRDRKLVVYTGKVYVGHPETEFLLDAARALEDHPDILFVMVGGRADAVSHFRDRVRDERRPNVSFVGFVPPREIQNYHFAADILALYYPSDWHLGPYLSPGKLFDYMAAARPIVACDLPVLREVLGDEPAAALVPPDAPDLLAAEILALLGDPERCDRLSRDAARRVRAFTWTARAQAIVDFVTAPTRSRA